MSYTRFAIYYLPPEGALADFGAAWLGWDCVTARAVVPPHVPGLHDVTMTPRKYGFHGTLKPPFRLAERTDLAGLQEAMVQMAAICAPAQSDGLALTALGRFLALTPVGDSSGIARVAATYVEALDAFRAPPGEAELARRRKARLSERQEALLQRWGYPYVMGEFRFHMTLSKRIKEDNERDTLMQEILKHGAEALATPVTVDAISVFRQENKKAPFTRLGRFAFAG